MSQELSDLLLELHDKVSGRDASGEAMRAPSPKDLPSTTKAECGTASGYQTHRRLDVPFCDECREAWAAYCRRWRKRNPGYYSRRST